LIGRTSMLPGRAIGIFAATWMASFRSRASLSSKPHSSPLRTRIVVALSTGCSALGDDEVAGLPEASS